MARTTRYDTTSFFPSSADNLIFFNDVDLDQIAESNYHNQLCISKEYTQAGEYLEQSAIMDSFCASLLNLIKNRIYTTQEYLLTSKHTKWYQVYGVESPFWNGVDEPTNKTQTPVWTGGS